MTEITFTGPMPNLARGSRIYVGGRRAIVTRVNSSTCFTVVMRDAWYWGVQWWILDTCEMIVRAVGAA